MCVIWHTCTMPPKIDTLADVEQWFRKQAASLWPAMLGSLSLRRSPCVREHCAVCHSGQQHASHVLYGRIKGRRFAIYIPDHLVPELKRCVDNGRALQELLYQSARTLYQSPQAPKGYHRSKGQKMTRIADPQIHFADMEFSTQALTSTPFSKEFPNSSTMLGLMKISRSRTNQAQESGRRGWKRKV